MPGYCHLSFHHSTQHLPPEINFLIRCWSLKPAYFEVPEERKWIFQYSTGELFHPLQYIQFRCIWKAGEKKKKTHKIRDDTFQKLSNKTPCPSFISPDDQTTWLHLKATYQIKVSDCSFYFSEVYSLRRSNTRMTQPTRISTSLKPEWRILLLQDLRPAAFCVSQTRAALYLAHKKPNFDRV